MPQAPRETAQGLRLKPPALALGSGCPWPGLGNHPAPPLSPPLREEMERVTWALRKAPVPVLPQVCLDHCSLYQGLHLFLSLASF